MHWSSHSIMGVRSIFSFPLVCLSSSSILAKLLSRSLPSRKSLISGLGWKVWVSRGRRTTVTREIMVSSSRYGFSVVIMKIVLAGGSSNNLSVAWMALWNTRSKFSNTMMRYGAVGFWWAQRIMPRMVSVSGLWASPMRKTPLSRRISVSGCVPFRMCDAGAFWSWVAISRAISNASSRPVSISLWGITFDFIQRSILGGSCIVDECSRNTWEILKNGEFLGHFKNSLERVRKSTLIYGIFYFLELLVFEHFLGLRLTFFKKMVKVSCS